MPQGQKNLNMKVAVVGATGLVGTKMLQVLAERNFPVTELIPVASERSVGKEVTFKGKQYKIVSILPGGWIQQKNWWCLKSMQMR